MFSACSEKRDFSVIAHRGASGYLPEHTLEGAALAHSWGVAYIEPDLVMTKDNQLIVMHDLYLDTTTDVALKFPDRKRDDGRYYAIDFALAEIKLLSVYERFKRDSGENVFPDRYPNKKSGFQVPTFEEFITLIQTRNKQNNTKIGIYPEIKKPEFHLAEGKDITAKVMQILHNFGYETSNEVIVQSFWPGSLKRVRREFKSNHKLVQLIAENSWGESSADYEKMLTDDGLNDVKKYADGIGVTIASLMKDPNLVRRAKQHNLIVHAYTHRHEQRPNGMSEEDYIRFIENDLGVDGIFSDFADRFLD